MSALLTLFLPLFDALVALLAQFSADRAKEVEAEVKAIFVSAFEITAAYFTADLTKDEAKAAFTILVDTMKAQGDTLLGKLEIESEKLPATIMQGLTDTLTSIPGALLKLL